MISNRIKGKGILAKLLESAISILVTKECKKINNLKVDIISSSKQIIKGEIQKINIIAEDLNYKDLLLDEIRIESNHLKINFNLINKTLYFKNSPKIEIKITLSQNSLKKVLLYSNWKWIGNMIREELLKKSELEDIKIKNGQLFLKTSEKNQAIKEEEQIIVRAEKGKIYLENKSFNKSIQVPIEDKIYIKDLTIENNLINIFANSYLSM